MAAPLGIFPALNAAAVQENIQVKTCIGTFFLFLFTYSVIWLKEIYCDTQKVNVV